MTKSVFSEKNNGNKIYLGGLYGMMVLFTGVSLYQLLFQFGYLSLLWVPPDFIMVQFFS